MEIIDLTQPLINGFPAFPGDPAPMIHKESSITRDGFRQHSLRLLSHSGTHIDAPAHMVSSGLTLDAMPAGHFTGRVITLDVSGAASITPRQLLEQGGEALFQARFILLRTGWSRLWGKQAYYRDYPTITPESARLLASLADPALPRARHTTHPADAGTKPGLLRGIGLDTPSPDAVASTAYPAHHVLFAAGLMILENLGPLEALIPHTTTEPCTLYALPLLYPKADGAPARVVAVKPQTIPPPENAHGAT